MSHAPELIQKIRLKIEQDYPRGVTEKTSEVTCAKKRPGVDAPGAAK